MSEFSDLIDITKVVSPQKKSCDHRHCDGCGNPEKPLAKLTEFLGISSRRPQAYCPRCADVLGFQCRDCKKNYTTSFRKIFTVNGDQRQLCVKCFLAIRAACFFCKDIFSADRLINIGKDNACKECYDLHRLSCDHCGHAFFPDLEKAIIEPGLKVFCRKCADRFEVTRRIKSHSFAKTWGIKRAFGVELECVPGGALQRRHDEEEDDNAEDADINASSWSGTEQERRGFSVGYDGSLGTGYGREFRSMILQGDKGLYLVGRMAKYLKDYGYTVNSACGFHVHIGIEDYSLKDFLNLFSFMAVFDHFLFMFLPESRRRNQYCRPLLVDKSTLTYLRREARIGDALKGTSRYKGFNFTALWRHHTIEFRYHAGTLDALKIRHWILLCLHIVEYGRAKNWHGFPPKTGYSTKNDLTKIGYWPTPTNIKRFFDVIKLPTPTAKFLFARYHGLNVVENLKLQTV